MSLASRRKHPESVLLILGLIAAGFCGFALVTGRFPFPLARPYTHVPFLVKERDPLLFLFWVRLSAIYAFGLCLLALVRIDLVEDWIESLPRFGKVQATGKAKPFWSELLVGLIFFLISCVCYRLTLKQ
jgi:hypothetical protein